MKTITVQTRKPYDIVIGEGILSQCGKAVKELFPTGRSVIVTDSKVASLYLDTVKQAYEEAGISYITFIFPEGESSKNPGILLELAEYMARRNICRGDFITALGGGVTGDLAGFAAAIYLRGINYIQIPTTLLAAVDASVGGKTAVDLEAGKNLIGAFHQPSLVWCDYETHKTMEPEAYADGIAEVVKCAVLKGEDFFSLLEQGDLSHHSEEVITTCVELKRRIVADDEYDTGKRQFLNLGHTIGHAIEAHSGYTISLGQAVAYGMVKIAEIAAANGLAEFDCCDRIAALLKRYRLLTECPYPLKELLPYIQKDKKMQQDTLHLIIPETIGRCRMLPISGDDIPGFFRL